MDRRMLSKIQLPSFRDAPLSSCLRLLKWFNEHISFEDLVASFELSNSMFLGLPWQEEGLTMYGPGRQHKNMLSTEVDVLRPQRSCRYSQR